MTVRRWLAFGAVMGALGLAWSPTQARELVASDDGETAWEGWGYFKNQALGFYFRDIPLYDADWAGQDSTRIRLSTEIYAGRFRAGVDYELHHTVRSEVLQQQVAGAFGSTSTRPRLWDIEPTDLPDVRLEHDIDRLFIAFSVGPADITVGRQVITWGSAWFWKPTDRFSPFSPMDIDPDVKRGVDAVRAEVFLGETSSLDLVASFERHADTDRELWVHGGARLRTTVSSYDLALSVARFQETDEGDFMVGAEFSGAIESVGFRGEAAFNIMEESHDWDIEAVVGADYHFETKTTLAGELFYNGYGAGDPDGYDDLLLDPVRGERLSRGEAFQLGRYYLGATVEQEANPLVTVTGSLITNLRDPSALLIAGVRWSVAENILCTAGVMVPFGERPEVVYGAGGLFPVGLSVPSEYGLAPALGYMVWKVSM